MPSIFVESGIEEGAAYGFPPGDVAHQLYSVKTPEGAAYRRRVSIMAAAMLFVFTLIWGRLFYLQVIEGAGYRDRSETVIRTEHGEAAVGIAE